MNKVHFAAFQREAPRSLASEELHLFFSLYKTFGLRPYKRVGDF